MSSQANWHSVTGIATLLFDGNLVAIAIAIAFTFGVPVLLHIIFFQAVASPPSSNFLLLGPSGAARSKVLPRIEEVTRHPHLPTIYLGHRHPPPTVPTGSNRYRSVNDPSLKEAIRNPIRYRVRDTPGHGKLRVSQGLAELSTMAQSKDIKTRLRGVLFMVDTAALVDEATLRDTATYLHDVLLVLQKRAKNGSSSKRTTEIPVLVAANKQDLFTALPPGSVREKLEAEIERIRKSKNKGLLDAADTGLEDEEEILANDEQESFTFKLLEFETGIKVEVVGGAVKGDQEEDFGSGVRRWEEWIGMCL
ncbi:Small GTPase superfamily ARF type [Penicillium brevicompactum]|uniref:Small GTPase superfamily ARF type n=1 Tax=Penicillium brevicompactum TaxID=5074 RepID=UPI0025407A59|nr:Small GTPase superfamily ARF type [Penicillium brevicompactum]KAJ5333480.1 Small GTPase superfamily ARF type [Penicillium brevicompactum]